MGLHWIEWTMYPSAFDYPFFFTAVIESNTVTINHNLNSFLIRKRAQLYPLSVPKNVSYFCCSCCKDKANSHCFMVSWSGRHWLGLVLLGWTALSLISPCQVDFAQRVWSYWNLKPSMLLIQLYRPVKPVSLNGGYPMPGKLYSFIMSRRWLTLYYISLVWSFRSGQVQFERRGWKGHACFSDFRYKPSLNTICCHVLILYD